MLNLLKADSRYHQKKKTESAVIILLAICLIFSFCSCGKKDSADKPSTETAGSFELDKGKDSKTEIDKDGEYTTAKDVAEYIHTYHKLPSNYVTEKEAIKRGWKKNESPDKYGFMIGGRKFRNYEGLLPGGEDYKE